MEKCPWCGEGLEENPYHDCPGRVSCDSQCGALKDPQTIDELKAALEHWMNHGRISGCSHGC